MSARRTDRVTNSEEFRLSMKRPPSKPLTVSILSCRSLQGEPDATDSNTFATALFLSNIVLRDSLAVTARKNSLKIVKFAQYHIQSMLVGMLTNGPVRCSCSYLLHLIRSTTGTF